MLIFYSSSVADYYFMCSVIWKKLKAIESLIELRNGDSADAIEQGIKDTDKASQEFASRRMDKSIRAALSGQSVNDI